MKSFTYSDGIVTMGIISYNLPNNSIYSPVADPDLELRGCGEGGGRGSSVLIALPAFLPSVISSFITQNKGGGGSPPRPLP